MKIEANDPANTMTQVTEIQKSQQSNLPQHQLPPGYANTSSPGKNEAPTTDRVSINLEISRKTLETLQHFGQVGDFLNTLATNLRRTKEGLDLSSQTIEKMKIPLETIRKSFPPFGIDSRERKDLLMSYSSLRKEIEKLMVPPPPQPVYEKVQHLWQDLFSNPDGTLPAPQLAIDVPDSQVRSASAQLDSLSDQIATIGKELSNSIKAI